ncbi:hypothetical protein BC835DRAFT_1315331 [Cytidiella melzeri]|nr:hypothetical protein BC835DRAFT_1315331 [Cytidiella melzeri]
MLSSYPHYVAIRHLFAKSSRVNRGRTYSGYTVAFPRAMNWSTTWPGQSTICLENDLLTLYACSKTTSSTTRYQVFIGAKSSLCKSCANVLISTHLNSDYTRFHASISTLHGMERVQTPSVSHMLFSGRRSHRLAWVTCVAPVFIHSDKVGFYVSDIAFHWGHSSAR